MRAAAVLFLGVALSGCDFDSALQQFCAAKYGRSCPDAGPGDFKANGVTWVAPRPEVLAGDCLPLRVVVQSNSGFLLAPGPYRVRVTMDPPDGTFYSNAACSQTVYDLDVDESDGGSDVYFRSVDFGTTWFGHFELTARILDAGLISAPQGIDAYANVHADLPFLSVLDSFDAGVCVPGLNVGFTATGANGPVRSLGATLTVQPSGTGYLISASTDAGICQAPINTYLDVDWPYSAQDKITARFDLQLNGTPSGGQRLEFGGQVVRSDGGGVELR